MFFPPLDPANPRHRAALYVAAFLGAAIGVLACDVFLPALAARALEVTP